MFAETLRVLDIMTRGVFLTKPELQGRNRARGHMETPLETGDSFPTTQWSLVGRAAAAATPEQRREALAALLARYLPSLRRAIAILGFRSHDAEDLVQAFICDRVIQQNILAAADRTRGRFRSFIFVSLRNFVFNQSRARAAARRSPDRLVSLDDDGLRDAAPAKDSARDAFDEAWTREVMAHTLARMRQQCERARENGSRVWQVFEWRILGPATSGDEPLPYEAIAGQLANTTPIQAANLLVTAKRMFGRELRHVVAEYTRDSVELEEEIRNLKQLTA